MTKKYKVSLGHNDDKSERKHNENQSIENYENNKLDNLNLKCDSPINI